MKKIAIFLTALALFSCGTTHYIPTGTTTEVNIKDSTVVHIKDSVRIVEESRWKEYGGLLDTLEIQGNRSSMKAWLDTTNNILNGTLKESPLEEKYKVIYRDRWKVRDSIQVKEVPVEVIKEKEVRYIPWYCKILSVLGLISLIFICLKLFLKFYKPV